MALWYHTQALSNYSNWRLLFSCSAQASHCSGFSCCRAQVLGHMGSVVVAPRFQSTGSIVVPHRLTCSEAHGILPDRGSNPCCLHWQADFFTTELLGKPSTHDFFLSLRRLEIEGNFFNFIKSIYEKPTSIIPNGEKLSLFPIRLGTK